MQNAITKIGEGNPSPIVLGNQLIKKYKKIK